EHRGPCHVTDDSPAVSLPSRRLPCNGAIARWSPALDGERASAGSHSCWNEIATGILSEQRSGRMATRVTGMAIAPATQAVGREDLARRASGATSATS